MGNSVDKEYCLKYQANLPNRMIRMSPAQRFAILTDCNPTMIEDF
tara:strand:- start:9523 stop:9657 length:135 start_codon:yes stop_codon:yes gene_type:complete